MNAVVSLLNLTPNLKELPYSSALVFELRKDRNNKFYVKVLVKSNSYDEPFSLNQATVYGKFLVIFWKILIN